MKKLFKIILVVILLIILMFNIFSAINLPLFGFRMYTVQTGSMEPKIKIGDYIIVKSSSNYKLGDIVTYKNKENEYITHRIIKINDDNIITQGDANNTSDNPIKKEQIIGKVVYIFKFIKKTKTIFSSPIFWILTFILGTFLTLFIPNKDKI